MYCLILVDGFEEIEAVTTADILIRAGIPLKTVGISDKTVTGAHGIRILADLSPEQINIETIELIILPGGLRGRDNLLKSEWCKNAIVSAARRDRTVAAICAAPTVLSSLGLLNGKEATCYKGMENELGSAVFCPRNVVRDGNIITGASVGVTVEFALEIIEAVKGRGEKEKILKSIKFYEN